MQGYANAQIESVLQNKRRDLLCDTRMATLAEARALAFPDTRVRAACPPRLPRELTWGLRVAAARAFKAIRSRYWQGSVLACASAV